MRGFMLKCARIQTDDRSPFFTSAGLPHFCSRHSLAWHSPLRTGTPSHSSVTACWLRKSEAGSLLHRQICQSAAAGVVCGSVVEDGRREHASPNRSVHARRTPTRTHARLHACRQVAWLASTAAHPPPRSRLATAPSNQARNFADVLHPACRMPHL